MKKAEDTVDEDDAGSLNKKRLPMILGSTVGIGCVAAISLWPEYKASIQMVLYTLFVFGPLALGLWPSTNRRVFWIGAFIMFAAHGVVLYVIRSTFPFRSVLVVIPIALVEACAMYMLMLKMLGNEEAEEPR
jgi:hypothetical protein